MMLTMIPTLAACSLIAAGALLPPEAPPAGSTRGASALYAVIVGNNHSFESDTPDLHYADDDALLFAEMLAAHARRIDVLTALDQPTQQRFPTLAASTRLPTRAELLTTLGTVRERIEQEHRSGAKTELVFVFVGHGGLDDQGHGYMHLSDAAFTRADLFREVIAASPADTTHIVIDACNAFSFVAGRGEGDGAKAGDDDRFVQFLAGHDIADYPTVGVLAATSADRETHEWSEIQSGLFSYQLRSALRGAADVNGDGALEYSEIAAFVAAANANVPETAKRLSVFAWAPVRDRHAPLLHLGEGGGQRRVVLGDQVYGHLVVESDSGLRWAELNKTAGEVMTLYLPATQRFFLRDEQHELEIAPSTSAARITHNPAIPYWLGARGGVDRVLHRTLFHVPYGTGFYLGYVAGDRDLLPVSAAHPGPAAADETPAESPWGLGVAYRVSRFPLVPDHAEHGLAVRGTYALTPQTFLLAELEASRSSLASLRAHQGVRAAASLGVGYRLSLLSWLRVSSSVQAGYEVFAVGRKLANTDWTAALARLRIGASARVADGVWLDLGPAFSTHHLTIDGEAEWRDSAELLVGFEF